MRQEAQEVIDATNRIIEQLYSTAWKAGYYEPNSEPNEPRAAALNGIAIQTREAVENQFRLMVEMIEELNDKLLGLTQPPTETSNKE